MERTYLGIYFCEISSILVLTSCKFITTFLWVNYDYNCYNITLICKDPLKLNQALFAYAVTRNTKKRILFTQIRSLHLGNNYLDSFNQLVELKRAVCGYLCAIGLHGQCPTTTSASKVSHVTVNRNCKRSKLQSKHLALGWTIGG